MENQEAFMLETQHVSKHYGKLEVLKDINLQVKKGEVICLIGPSGAGKSTYLRSLNQLETITGGKIFIKGHLLLHREHDHTVERIDKKTQQQLLLEMGMCFQRFNLFPHKTVLDNVMMSPIIVKHEDKEQVRQEALTLRSNSEEINQQLETKLNERLAMAGIEVMEARINYLAYAPEIAAVMLRRQQADAVIAAREKIVEGAVSMVHMALERLTDEEVVELDEERKAAMVSNLLVVLCADEAAQPVVNTGTLHH